MDYEKLKECLEMCGEIASENESDCEAKEEFDENYTIYKPSPIPIDPKKYKIIQIEAGETPSVKNKSYADILKDRIYEEIDIEATNTIATASSVENEEIDIEATNSNATSKTRKRMKKKANVRVEAFTNSSSAECQHEDFPDNNEPNVTKKRENIKKKLKDFDVFPGVSEGNFHKPQVSHDQQLKNLKQNNENSLLQENKCNFIFEDESESDDKKNGEISGNDAASEINGTKRKRRRRRRRRGKESSSNTPEDHLLESNLQSTAETINFNLCTDMNSNKFLQSNIFQSVSGNPNLKISQFPNAQNFNKHVSSYTNQFHLEKFQYMYTKLQEMYIYLNYFIQNYPSSTLDVDRNVNWYLSTIQQLGIPLLNCIHQTALNISKISRLYEEFVKVSLWRMQTVASITEFVQSIEMIVNLDDLTKKNHESELHQAAHPVLNYIYDSLKCIVSNFKERIVSNILIAMSIPGQYKSLTNVVSSTYLNRTFGPENMYLGRSGSLATSIRSGKKARNKDKVLSGRSDVTNKTVHCQFEKQVVDDITVDRRYVNDGTSFNSNFLSNVETSETVKSRRQTRNQDKADTTCLQCHIQGQDVIDDMTADRRYFYDGSYFESNFQSWQQFQERYLNDNVTSETVASTKTEQLECLTTEIENSTSETVETEQLQCLKQKEIEFLTEENAQTYHCKRTEYPSSVAVRILLFVLFTEIFLRPLSYFLTYGNVVILILVFIYLCTLFVVKF